MQWTNTKEWANVDLDRQTEHEAAIATRDFLLQVKAALQDADLNKELPYLTVPFTQFDKPHLAFLLTAIGTGEVRAIAGENRAEETGIHGLWRIQEKGIDRLEVTRIPQFVLDNLSTGTFPEEFPEATQGVFAAPAILKELQKAQAGVGKTFEKYAALYH